MYVHIEDPTITPSAATTPPSQPDLADDSRAVALRIAEILAETPASDTVVLDLHEISSFADYFVICSGENERQLRAISLAVSEKLAEAGIHPRRTEGTPAAGWIVLDYNETVVHVFEVSQREYYRLESLWSEAPTLLAIQ